MKKFLSTVLAVLIVTGMFSFNLSAKAAPSAPSEETSASENDVNAVYGIYNSSPLLREEGLFAEKYLFIEIKGTQLYIEAKTKGNDKVEKCGFTYIRLQIYMNGAWSDYSSYCYTDIYSESNIKLFSVYASVPFGYSYRVICEHYVEKPKLVLWTSNETSYNETPPLYF